jgi:hypothetical protein
MRVEVRPVGFPAETRQHPKDQRNSTYRADSSGIPLFTAFHRINNRSEGFLPVVCSKCSTTASGGIGGRLFSTRERASGRWKARHHPFRPKPRLAIKLE